jgi:hypothetical protein
MLKHIAVILMGMIFLISSSGFMIYKSNCSCSGDKQVTVFVTPETCESEFHQHHEHDGDGNEVCCSAHECEDCSTHTDDCGCSSPEATYLKLKNPGIEEEAKFLKVQPFQIFVAFNLLAQNTLEDVEVTNIETFYVDPPPITTSSLDFLIQIHQLKISCIA